MNHIKAMKQALYCVEAWERGCERDAYWRDIDDCITTLRTAIEAAEKQEPVGYFSVNDYGNWEQNESGHGEPFYTTPPAAQPTPCNPAEDGVCEALECCKQQLEDARTEAVALRVNEQNLIAALERACNTAMQQSLIARIPECGHFAGIAQDLDWVLDQMPATIRARGTNA